jgi:dihydroorotate dehydrogenase electron transfer subunit
LVRRPFSFSRIDRVRGEVGILFRVIGRGTEAMSHMKPGASVSLLGPLGNGFDIGSVDRDRTAILVGGGIGIAPFHALAQVLRRKGVPILAFFGGLDEVNLPITLSRSVSAPSVPISGVKKCIKADEYEALGIPTAISTETGRRGFQGYVSALLQGYLKTLDRRRVGCCEIFACGPWDMLAAVAEIARRHKAPCQILLEGVMGCGLGVCMSCVCDVISAGGARAHKRICVDGPMFRAEEIDWTGGPHGRTT